MVHSVARTKCDGIAKISLLIFGSLVKCGDAVFIFFQEKSTVESGTEISIKFEFVAAVFF